MNCFYDHGMGLGSPVATDPAVAKMGHLVDLGDLFVAQ